MNDELTPDDGDREDPTPENNAETTPNADGEDSTGTTADGEDSTGTTADDVADTPPSTSSPQDEPADVAPPPSTDMPEPIAGDDEAGSTEDEDAGSVEFAQLLADSDASEAKEPNPGDEVTGTIVQIDEQSAFVDCGGRCELPLAITELRGEDGDLSHQVGDEITAHVQKVNDELKLTLAINLREAGLKALEDAFEDGTPVEGTIRDTNKGGFAIDLGGYRAFCPFSQIGLRRVEDPTQFIDQKLPFKILELSNNGRNIVVSRRQLLQAERDSKANETRANLNLGDVIEGTVTRLVPFGAFVDIGGVEGLVHISQISHQRIKDASSVLGEGQPVKVQVMEIQNLGQGRSERISLSMKALAEDPWPKVASQLQIAADIPGKITRLADFGAFVEVSPGIEGLIHISEMAHERVFHPRDVVSEGEEVIVRILDIDMGRRRISLSLKQVIDEQED